MVGYLHLHIGTHNDQIKAYLVIVDLLPYSGFAHTYCVTREMGFTLAQEER